MQKLIDELHRAFLVLITPACWVRSGLYSPIWDKRLNELMKREKFKVHNKYVAKISDFDVWIGNHPYSSFSLEAEIGKFKPFSMEEVLPRRSTAILAHKKMIKDLVEESGN